MKRNISRLRALLFIFSVLLLVLALPLGYSADRAFTLAANTQDPGTAATDSAALSPIAPSDLSVRLAGLNLVQANKKVTSTDDTSSQADAARATPLDGVRLLEQSTFGPTTDLISHVAQIGLRKFLHEQEGAAKTDYPILEFWPQTRPATCTGNCQRDNYSNYLLQQHFFLNALNGQDQLRQRLAFALSEILVVSASDVPLPSWMRGYQQLLYSSALGNFRQLLYDVTLNPTMGRFLDMLNNRCQTRTPPDANVCRNGLTSQPNENYAREILQLFSIGTFVLNQDGSDDAGIIGATEVQDAVGNDADLFVGVKKSEHCLCKSEIGEILVSPFGGVFDSVGEELKLVHEVRKEGFVNLCELEFPLRQMAEHFFDNRRGNRSGPAIHKIYDFRHGRTL